MQRWIPAAAGVLAATFAAAAQTPAEKCRLEGTVLNAVTGQPVRKARITLTPAQGGGEPMLASTDAQGKYALANIAPGTYNLTAARDGYFGQRYGARKPGEEQKGEVLDLAPGSAKSDVDLKLTPLGAIMGFVRDEDGDPVRGVNVVLLAYGYGPSGRKLQVRGSETETDALGEYRIFDLPAGTYYLRAKPMSEQAPAMEQGTEAYATVYYPNSQQPAGAGAIQLAAGEVQRGIDFVLHTIAISFIRGRVIKPAGGLKCSAALEAGADELQGDFLTSGGLSVVGMVSGSDITSLDFDVAGARQVDPDGKFEFRNVPVGNHSLTGTCRVGKQRYTTNMPVQLDTVGLENVELRPVGPSTITGQVTIEGESKSKVSDARVSLSGGQIFFLNVDGDSDSRGNVAEDGTFRLPDLVAGVYRINVKPPDGLYVKSIAEDGSDVAQSGVDLSAGAMTAAVQVVLSANGGSIEGSVENGAGAQVTLIPSDPETARMRAQVTTADPHGRFAFPALAPGHYQLYAWEGVDIDAAMYDADFRKPFESKAQTVDVEEKQKATAQLQLIPTVE